MMADSDLTPVSVEPYTALAATYDLVMRHVDYADWAKYIDALITRYLPDAETVLELGCGTGTFARELRRLRPLRYLATDASPEMIRMAEREPQPSLAFDVADFRDLDIDGEFDLVLLLYDGVNYLLAEAEVLALLSGARRSLRSGGVFLFDQSTPANSINNSHFFEDAGGSDELSYVRTSDYDEETRLHHTTFEIVLKGRLFLEHHVQRAYTLDEMRALVHRAGWSVVAALDGFGTESATPESERIQWILGPA